jgi:hypothetical protein
VVSGRGVIQWTSTLLQERLQEAEKDAARGVPVRVVCQTGKMALLELSPNATVEVLQQIVEQRAGLLVERQNLIVEERPAPTVVGTVANSLLLHGFKGLCKAAGVASWTGHKVKKHLWGDDSCRVTVRTHSGLTATLEVTGDMTVRQLQEMMQARADSQVPKQQRLLGAATAAPTRPTEMLAQLNIPDAPAPSPLEDYLVNRAR